VKITPERAREIADQEFERGFPERTPESFVDSEGAVLCSVDAILRAVEEEREHLCELVCPDCGSGAPKTETAGVPHCPDCGRIQVKGTRIVRAEFERGKGAT